MHHGILIKANGKDLKDAQTQVESMLDDTLACGHCGRSARNVNWDYQNFIAEVTPAWIKKNKSEKKVKTVDDLVKHYIKLRQVELNYLEKRISEEMAKTNAVLEETGHYPQYSMLGYYLDRLEDLQSVIEFQDADEGLYTLHCTENHYADLTEYTEGKKAFYMWFDRHY
jgi:hypothetical protein